MYAMNHILQSMKEKMGGTKETSKNKQSKNDVKDPLAALDEEERKINSSFTMDD